MKQAIKLARCTVAMFHDRTGLRMATIASSHGGEISEIVYLAENRTELDALIRALESLRDELPDGPAPKWVPKIGDVVFARHDRALDREYVAEGQRERGLFGFGLGTVIRISGAHGPCFTLRRENGHEAVFNLSELSPIGAEP